MRKVTTTEVDLMFTHICAQHSTAQDSGKRPSSVDPIKKAKKKLTAKPLKRDASVTMASRYKTQTSSAKPVPASTVHRFDFECFKVFIVRLSRKCLSSFKDPLECP